MRKHKCLHWANTQGGEMVEAAHDLREFVSGLNMGPHITKNSILTGLNIKLPVDWSANLQHMDVQRSRIGPSNERVIMVDRALEGAVTWRLRYEKA